MNLFRASRAVFALGLLIVLACCTKSDPFGKELFTDPSGLTFSDTMTIKTSIVLEDSTNTNISPNQLLGLFNDPVFGKTEAVINTNFWPGQLGYKFKANSTCEAAFLYVHYDASRFYGDSTALQSVEVWRTAEVISPDSSYFSGAKTTATVKIGELLNFQPHPLTKLIQRDTSRITTQVDTLGAYFAIPIDVAFAQEILSLDSASLSTPKSFTEKMRGLQIRVVTPGGSPCMMSVILDRTSFSRLTMFFKEPDSTRTKTFHCFFTANKWVTLTHDYTGTPFASSIGTETTDNLFVQGGAGLRVKIELPFVKNLTNIAINQAELELTLLEPSLPGDNLTLFPAPSQLLLSKFVAADKNTLFTSDVYAAAGTGLTGSFGNFGGDNDEEQTGVHKYRLNLSDHLQDMITGKEPNVIYLNVFPTNQVVHRGIFVGTGGSATARAKINLKYSKF